MKKKEKTVQVNVRVPQSLLHAAQVSASLDKVPLAKIITDGLLAYTRSSRIKRRWLNDFFEEYQDA